jgi:hypothetical protein
MAATWLVGMTNKPTIVTVDNEIEIASSTHQDMHPNPMGFDEELSRVLATAKMAKATLPNVKVAAPSTCAWWFCEFLCSSAICCNLTAGLDWTSSIGYSDNAAHNSECDRDFSNASRERNHLSDIDFLPWFLAQMNTASQAAGKRLLDYLGVYYTEINRRGTF